MSWASMLPTYYLAANSSSVVVYSFLLTFCAKWALIGRFDEAAVRMDVARALAHVEHIAERR